MPAVLVPTENLLRNVYLRGSGSIAGVALTFDDGPNGRCTEAVLDSLAATGTPATFFVIGRNVETGRNDALLARMVREGHTIGLHSQSHHVRPLLFRSATANELKTASGAVAAALRRSGISQPPATTLFRPPYGFLTRAAAEGAASAGYAIVEWTVSVGDWRPGQSAESIADLILAQVQPGDIIVLHDGDGVHQRSAERCVDRPRAAEVVRLLVPRLASRGLRTLPLRVLLGLDPPAMTTAARPR